MLPFIHELLEVFKVLIPSVLIVLDLLLSPLVPFVGSDKFHNVFLVILDPEVRLSLLLDQRELSAGLLHLGIRQICLRRDILPRCAFRLRFIANRRVRLLKLLEHVVRGESLNHRHKLLDPGCHSLAIKNCHQVVDQRLLVRQGNVCIHAPLLELIKHFRLVFLNNYVPFELFGFVIEALVLVL